MERWPRGTVAFLFTDLEASTALWDRFPAAMPAVYERHDAILRQRAAACDGVVFKVIGDAFQIAFPTAPAAAAAAAAAQRDLADETWPVPAPIRIRMALHVAPAAPTTDGDYRLPALNRLGRLLAIAHGGQVLATAEFVAALAADPLPDVATVDLGEVRLRDLRAPERVARLAASGLPDRFPPLLAGRVGNLPPVAAPLVGRDAEVDTLVGWLATGGIRLATLTGPGGVGKTRLARAVAGALGEPFADGAWWVDLAAVTDPARVLPAIAEAVGIVETPGRAAPDALRAWLAPRRALLVLDNLEQVLAAAPAIADLLTAPDVAILATSRAPLKVVAEHEFPVSPLPVPVVPNDPVTPAPVAADGPARLRSSRLGDHQAGRAGDGRTDRGRELQADRAPDALPVAASGLRFDAPVAGAERDELAALAANPAVRLFVERAAAIRPGFALTAANAPAVAEICRRLDGLPLAIELAAARSRLLSPPALAARLEKRLPLLTGGGRDRPRRQQALRATVAWSVDLLPEAARRLFARLARFAGGVPLAAVEAIGGGDDPFGAIELLAEQSLVRVDPEATGGPRLTMLETVREYAAEELAAAGEDAATATAHAAWFLDLAEQAAEAFNGPDEPAWLDRLATDRENLRLALAYWCERPDGDEAIRLAAALWWFWWVRGYLRDGLAWLERALARPAAVAPERRALALTGVGTIAGALGQHALATARLEEALALARAANHAGAVSWSLANLAAQAQAAGDLRRAEALFEESLAGARAAGDDHGAAQAMVNLGAIAALRGATRRSVALVDEALPRLRDLGDAHAVAGGVAALAFASSQDGRLDEATALFARALDVWRELGDDRGAALALANLAELAAHRGAFAEAAVQFDDAAERFADLDDAAGLATVAVGRAWAAWLAGEPESDARALRVLAEAVAASGPGTVILALDLVACVAAERQPLLAARAGGAAAALLAATGLARATPVAERVALAERAAARLGRDAYTRAFGAAGADDVGAIAAEAAAAARDCVGGQLPV